MNLQEQYKKETNLEAYELDTLNNGYDNFKYVKWLEEKLTLTDVSQRIELLAKYTKWQNEVIYANEENMYLDIDRFLNG
jgi:hypothetical protein